MNTPENPPPPGGDEPGRGLSGGQRWLIVLGALAVLLIVFVVLQGGDDSGSDSSSSPAQTTASQSTSSPSTSTSTSASASTAESTGSTSTEDESESETGSTSGSTSTSDATVPASRTINVVNGQPQGGIKTVSFKKNDQVVLKVNSDVADEIHVHGYDLMKDVEKGGSVTFNFKATIEGRFEVELEDAGTQIANLEVTPQ
jgi:cytoskeletal protein RodZ